MNSQTDSSAISPVKNPRIWLYAIAFLILIPVWIVVLELIIKPRVFAVSGFPLIHRVILYLLPPLVAVLSVFFIHLAVVRKKRQKQEARLAEMELAEATRAAEEESRQAAILKQKRFTLEVLSVGVAVEYLRQTEVWDELQSRDNHEAILSTDPQDYPADLEDKEKAHRERESEVLEHALGWLNDEWAIPVFLAGPALSNPQMLAVMESNLMEALDHGEIAGRKLNIVETLHDDTPDQLFQKVFDFMDRNTEVPAVLLVAEDGMVLRHYLRSEDSPDLIYDGPRPEDAMTETVVAILLGRKERIEPMRFFIQGDTKGEDPLKPYWEREELARSIGVFKTTEWVPAAWSKALVQKFSDLPAIAKVHRPKFAFFDGSGAQSRANSVEGAWRESLDSLEQPSRNEHLVYDFGDVDLGRRIVPLSRAMGNLDPDFDIIDQGINLHRQIGDTGAATPFLGLALAAMSSHRERAISASVFLRREDGASIFMISPPDEAEESGRESPQSMRTAG